ncbi:LysR family transcriptional regulator [Sinorhizobium alkalisoli]|uniref:LysR family transcriptional regulator n=1 Tax=Sinorhizobium alkalisoli TaxID=1752398 RepID=A0A1E3VBF7_9HYPH|nr:LysR family transcriptional regulator [Sinorhizobium alkalisoli]MCA1492747.1 LysR family transcriptional regulator [Ensifer sp. NBAIM29]MCG5480072.1 LysR family transcriptional regulator [Sinorhizobium alkalisoli]ODR90757.1 LysR family transcriptional regulator [Sinorhizobium alkalisoli]QFI67809.1 Transcriptional regulator, LysR family [Sinorhizobium alkalisoli]
MNANFTWDDLQFFLAVARTGQLSTAARRLRTSHATVSRRIDRLEFSLKVKLFERNPRGYVLTAMGQRFVETAERIERETEQLQLDISDSATAQRGVVRLSTLEGFGNFFLADRLSDFASRYPNISLELVAIQQIMALSRKEADIAVSLAAPKAGPYHAEVLTPYTLHVYGARSYLAKHPLIRTRNDLASHRFVGYIEDMIFAPGLDYLGEIQPGLRAHFQSSSILTQLKAACQGLGLCVLPHFMARNEPALEIVLPGEVELKRTYWLICHRDLMAMPRVRAVRDFLVELAGESQGCFLKERPAHFPGQRRPLEAQ